MSNAISKIWADRFTEKRGLDDRFYSYIFNVVKKKIAKDKTCKWLDIGCGDGRILIPLALRFPLIKFFGIDNNNVMVSNLNKIVKTKKIYNLSSENKSGEYYLNKKIRFRAISFFQSIHFFNYKEILKKSHERLEKGGWIIIATTTHDQFKSIPYSSDPLIYQIEIKRTPSWPNIVSVLKKQKLKLKAIKSFSVSRVFNNSAELGGYLNSIPYSALGLLKPKERKVILEKIVNKYRSKKRINFTVDKFTIGIFQLYE